MATASRTGGSSSGDDWEAIFQERARHTLSLCRLVRTSTPSEAEYAKLLAEILERLLSWVVFPSPISNPEKWNKKATSFLCQLDAKLDPDDSLRHQSPTERPAVRWQLKSDEVKQFVNVADTLIASYRVQHVDSNAG